MLNGQCAINHLPLIQAWPQDGGAFITLPQVYTTDPAKPGVLRSNLGMYRVQMQGNQYRTNQQVGLHYQIHRGIGAHHARALALQQTLPVSIFVGGPPAHTLAAIMPLPEGVPEVAFGGALAARNWRYTRLGAYTIAADADFCITGTIEKNYYRKVLLAIISAIMRCSILSLCCALIRYITARMRFGPLRW